MTRNANPKSVLNTLTIQLLAQERHHCDPNLDCLGRLQGLCSGAAFFYDCPWSDGVTGASPVASG
ncbi:MAG: hypothetical protein ACXWCY_14145 [Burkholderiales bacterium]